jgi:hypothetical protein
MTAGTEWNPAVGATPDTFRNDGSRPFLVSHTNPAGFWGKQVRRQVPPGHPATVVRLGGDEEDEATRADYQPAHPQGAESST